MDFKTNNNGSEFHNHIYHEQGWLSAFYIDGNEYADGCIYVKIGCFEKESRKSHQAHSYMSISQAKELREKLNEAIREAEKTE